MHDSKWKKGFTNDANLTRTHGLTSHLSIPHQRGIQRGVSIPTLPTHFLPSQKRTPKKTTPKFSEYYRKTTHWNLHPPVSSPPSSSCTTQHHPIQMAKTINSKVYYTTAAKSILPRKKKAACSLWSWHFRHRGGKGDAGEGEAYARRRCGRGQTPGASVSYWDAQNPEQYHYFLRRSCCCHCLYLNSYPDYVVEDIAFERDSAEDECKEPGWWNRVEWCESLRYASSELSLTVCINSVSNIVEDKTY